MANVPYVYIPIINNSPAIIRNNPQNSSQNNHVMILRGGSLYNYFGTRKTDIVIETPSPRVLYKSTVLGLASAHLYDLVLNCNDAKVTHCSEAKFLYRSAAAVSTMSLLNTGNNQNASVEFSASSLLVARGFRNKAKSIENSYLTDFLETINHKTKLVNYAQTNVLRLQTKIANKNIEKNLHQIKYKADMSAKESRNEAYLKNMHQKISNWEEELILAERNRNHFQALPVKPALPITNPNLKIAKK
jgi:hypothetical protein